MNAPALTAPAMIWPPAAARAMASMVTSAMVDAIPPRAPGPLGLGPATPGARLALADQQRIAAAMAEVMNRRVRSIKRGKTIEHNLVLGDCDLLRKAKVLLGYAFEDCARRPLLRRDAMIHAAECAAVLLAFVEVQHERLAQEEAQEATDQPKGLSA